MAAEFLRSKVRWYSFCPKNAWWYGIHSVLGGILVLVLLFGIFVIVPDGYWRSILLGVVAFLTIFGILPWAGDRVWFGGSRIYLHASFGKKSFWERNRDTIVVSSISSVITGLVGFVLGRLTS